MFQVPLMTCMLRSVNGSSTAFTICPNTKVCIATLTNRTLTHLGRQWSTEKVRFLRERRLIKEILLALMKWVMLNIYLSHQTLTVKPTLKQDEAKNERRSLSTTFSINRRRGRMCELGAVLKKKITEMNSGFIASNIK